MLRVTILTGLSEDGQIVKERWKEGEGAARYGKSKDFNKEVKNTTDIYGCLIQRTEMRRSKRGWRRDSDTQKGTR